MKRKGSLAASTLFHSDNETLWKQSLDLYQEAVKLKADMHPSTTTKDLVSIDQWFHIKLPKLIEEQGHLTTDQLCGIMDWKLKRGQFRPLMKLVRSNSSATVEKVTREAFGDAKDPIKVLSQLSGIGPATASAILMCVDSFNGKYPFMSDEAVEASGLKLEYTAKAYKAFTSKMVDKSAQLGSCWTPELVGKALWTHAIISAFGPAEHQSQLGDDDETSKPAKKGRKDS